MRTKDEIIGNIFDDLKAAQSLGHIEKAIDLPLLEVLIDIRDCMDRFFTSTNTLMQEMKHRY